MDAKYAAAFFIGALILGALFVLILLTGLAFLIYSVVKRGLPRGRQALEQQAASSLLRVHELVDQKRRESPPPLTEEERYGPK